MLRIVLATLLSGCLLRSAWSGESSQAGIEHLRALLPTAVVTAKPDRTTVAIPFRPGDPAVPRAAAAADASGLVRGFLDEHRLLFGHGGERLEASRLVRDDTSPHSRLRTLVWQHEIAGIPVRGATVVGHIAHDRSLMGLTSTGLQTAAIAPVHLDPLITAAAALQAAAATIDVAIADLASSAPAGATRRQRLSAPGLHGLAHAWLTWLPRDGALILCWEIRYTPESDRLTRSALIDASDGTLIRQRIATIRDCFHDRRAKAAAGANPVAKPAAAPRLATRAATLPIAAKAPTPSSGSPAAATTIALRCFAWPNESPRPLLPGRAASSDAGNQPAEVARDLLTLTAIDATASPAGWVTANLLQGNNVDAYLDVNADDATDAGRPTGTGSPLTFDFPLDLTLAPSDANNRKAATVNLFYWCNFMHDRLYQVGFTETAGNFQADNFGRGGQGGDLVLAEAQDGSGSNNANFTPAPDGIPGRMQMYVFTAPTPDRDGDFDATIISHEYVHGLSTRLVGGGAGDLATDQAGGLGEGWSDFYAIALLSQAGDDVSGNYAVGSYVTQNHYAGVRQYPYTTDLGRNPLTLANMNGLTQVHQIGTIWCTILWEVRCALVAKYGFAGNERALRLITDGLKLTPDNPTVIEARDAIIQAGLAGDAGADLRELWTAFAKRGLGPAASTPVDGTTSGTTADTSVPGDLLVMTGGAAPGGRLELVGDPGGPFLPTSATISLRNLSQAGIAWSASCDAAWLTLGASGGSLAAVGATTLSITGNSITTTLAPGYYQATITVTNNSGGSGTTSIPVGLAVCTDYDAATTAYAWIDPTAHATLTLGDDAVSAVQTIPFPFRFYGRDRTQFWVGSNGLIGFLRDRLEAWTNSDLPGASTPNAIICPWWDDLYPPQSGARVSIGTVGSAPNRQLVVTWSGVPQVGSFANGFTFQVVLTEGSDTITMQYQEVRPALAGIGAGRSATIGIEQDSGLRATRWSFQGGTPLSNQSAIRFTPRAFVPVAPAFTSTPVTAATVGLPYQYTLAATGVPAPTFSTSGLPGWLSRTGNRLSGTPTTAGTTGTITCTAGNGLTADAVQTFTITVAPTPAIPVFTSVPVTTGSVGAAYRYTLAAAGSPTPTFSASGLPAWLTLSGNVLSGTPTSAGSTGTITVTAANGVAPDAIQTFSIAIAPAPAAPVFSSIPVTTGTVGVAYQYTLTATGFPTPTFSASGLPAWLTLNGNLLSGTPAIAGSTATMTLTAANGLAPDATQAFSLAIAPAPTAPVITSVPVTTASVGSVYQYTLAATGVPTPTFSAGGLPAWLTLSGSTLSGTPTDAGTTDAIVVSASNGVGAAATQTFTITVAGVIAPAAGDSGGKSRRCGFGAGLAVLALLVITRPGRRPRA